MGNSEGWRTRAASSRVKPRRAEVVLQRSRPVSGQKGIAPLFAASRRDEHSPVSCMPQTAAGISSASNEMSSVNGTESHQRLNSSTQLARASFSEPA